LKEDDPRGALLGFQGVLDLEEKKQKKEEWGFKALKQMLKLLFKMVCMVFICGKGSSLLHPFAGMVCVFRVNMKT
jgi:hypothetical protein